jgi:hypothetical protein
MAMLSRLAAPTRQLGDHQVTRYLSVVVDSSRTYVSSEASRYNCGDLEDIPVADLHTGHFRYSGLVRFVGDLAIMVKDGYFEDWLETFDHQDSANFVAETPELWEGDAKQAAFEAGLSSCGLIPWWDESCPLEEGEEQPVPKITGEILRRLQAGPVEPPLVFRISVCSSIRSSTNCWDWHPVPPGTRVGSTCCRRPFLAGGMEVPGDVEEEGAPRRSPKSASPSPVSSVPGSPTTPEASKWKEEAPRPKLFGQFDPTKYGLPQEFRGDTRAA